jgi:hypothetical protein
LDNLDAEEKGNGYMALCPAHDDKNPSLSITPKPGGVVLVHCHAGCTYAEVLAAMESGDGGAGNSEFSITKRNITSGKPAQNAAKTHGPVPDAAEWWVQYTGVPQAEWECWGARFTAKEIIFGWADLVTEKYRRAGTKEMGWRPDGCATPPLWPQIPAASPERIYVTEGESDCGVMRHLGFDAYALMKGVSATKKTAQVWMALQQRGVQEVVFVLDLDEESQKHVETYVDQARGVGMRTHVLRLNGIVDTLLGEKDPRDVWTRTHDPLLKERFEENTFLSGGLQKKRVDIMSFMQQALDDVQWIVQDVLLQGTVGMIVGAPKMGKTWLAHDLMISIATGTPFLGHFPVRMKGPVIYISKEDPDYLLHDRFAKVLHFKGIGGSVVPNRGRITLPPVLNVPVFIELDRDFMFSNEGDMKSLLEYLIAIRDQYGFLALTVFDPVLRMIPADIDVYNAVEVNNAIFQPAETIRKETGASVLLVHHRNKGGSEGKGSFGSIGFHAFSEGTHYLMGDEPDKDGWVHVRGEFKSAAETRWAYRLGDLRVGYTPEVVFGAIAPSKKSIVRDMVLLELKDGALHYVADVAKKVGVSTPLIKTVLMALQEEGQVESELEPAGTEQRKGGRPRTGWRIVEYAG